MQIDELSNNIDQKLSELDQQLADFKTRYATTTDATQQQKLAADITALNKIKLKLLRSQDLAWRAHQLKQENDNTRREDQQRLLGLWLCIFSGVAALILVGIYLWSGIF